MQDLSISPRVVRNEVSRAASARNLSVVSKAWKGYAASHGKAYGRCTVIYRMEDLHKVQPGAILVCPTASPKLAVVMPRLAGLVTEQGGVLSIGANYARECGIPAVVGVQGIMEKVHDGSFIRVDGDEGTVEIIG
jgi:phosphoenolpyruvate synthase/pyruvate phosphate dikinase